MRNAPARAEGRIRSGMRPFRVRERLRQSARLGRNGPDAAEHAEVGCGQRGRGVDAEFVGES
ncbi:hypothetical protein [Glycomyces tarimensis]